MPIATLPRLIASLAISPGPWSLDRALALDPSLGRALNQAANVYLKMGEPAKAMPYLERYAAANSGDPNPRDSIAEMLMRTGRLDDSVAKYKEVLAAYPDFFQSWKNLAYVYALQEKYPEALRCLDEMIARAPAGSVELVGAWLRAFLRDFLGQWDQALAEFRDLKTLSEKSGDEYSLMATSWMLAFVHLDRGEPDEAEREIESFLGILVRRNPARPSMTGIVKTILRARLDVARGRTEAALALMKEAEAVFSGLDPATREEFAFAWADTKAEAWLAAGRADDVIAARDKISLGILPGVQINDIASYNQPFLKDVLARAYWKKGDLDRAAAEYRKLLTIDPANQVRALISPLYHYRLGRVLEEKGDLAGARAEYEKFLAGWKDADPSHPELADARRRLAAK